MELQLLKILNELPTIVALLGVSLLSLREIAKYMKSRDSITGAVEQAEIALEKETEITHRGTTKELFALFREINKLNAENAKNDVEYRKNALNSQYEIVQAIRNSEHTMEKFMDAVSLPEKRIIEAIESKLEAMKNGFLAYHDQNKQEILDFITMMFKDKS